MSLFKLQQSVPTWVPKDAAIYSDGINDRHYVQGIGTLTFEQLWNNISSPAMNYLCSDNIIRETVANKKPYITGNYGPLIEPSMTNYLLWSRDLTNAAWIKTTMNSSKTATGWDNVSSSATTITATNDMAMVLQSLTLSSAERTFSLGLKRRTGTGNINITMDGITWTPVSVTSNWSLFWMTATQLNPIIGIQIETSGDTIDVDYCQIEDGSVPTSPVVTTTSSSSKTSTVIYSTLNAAINLAKNISTGVSLYSESQRFTGSGVTGGLIALSDGTTSNRYTSYISTADLAGAIINVSGGATGSGSPTITIPNNSTFRVATSAQTSNISVCKNGGTLVSNTPSSLPSINRIYLGTTGFNGSLFNGHISKVAIYNSALSNAKLQQITLPVNPWGHSKSIYTADFKNNRYWLNGASANVIQMVTTSRLSTNYMLDNNGVSFSFSNNNASVLPGIGVSIQDTFTNKIRNPRGESGVVGTVGVTNKCTGYNATGATTGISKSGNASATLATVSDTGALQAIAASDAFIAAGLANGFLTGNVLEIDNTVGAGNVDITCAGAIGATGPASVQAYVRGVTAAGGGLIGLNDGSIVTGFNYTTSYVRRTASGTAGSSGSVFFLRIPFGIKARVLLFQISTNSPVTPVPTVVAGASATGALPTNWAYEDLTTSLKCSFFGVNTEAGVPYADVRISGTSVATTNVMRIRFDQSNNATAAVGQAWGLDFGGKLLSGVSPSVYARLTAFNSSSALSDGASGTATPLTSSKVHRTAKGVLSDAAVNNVRGALYMDVTSGNAYDFTFRIYAPKLVQVAVVTGTPNTAGYLPTFPILPAAGVIADSTKLADDTYANVSNTNPFVNFQSGEYSIGVGAYLSYTPNSTQRRFAVLGSDANNRISIHMNSSNTIITDIVVAGSTVLTLTGPTISSIGNIGICTRIKDTDYTMYVTLNGITNSVSNSSSISMPNNSILRLGSGFGNIEYLNDTIKEISIYSSGMTNNNTSNESIRLSI